MLGLKDQFKFNHFWTSMRFDFSNATIIDMTVLFRMCMVSLIQVSPLKITVTQMLPSGLN